MNNKKAQRIGLYIDVANITRNGGYGMRFDVLRDFACRDSGEPIRLNAYVAYDEERTKTDHDYRERTFNFHSTLRDYGYKVIMATGDGDFVQVVRALQNKGCRVESVAFQNVSSNLKREVDLFMSGYLIPNLLPIDGTDNKKHWGEEGSRVRGICYTFNKTKKFGFMRYLVSVAPGLWITDTRRPESPYDTAFAHESNFDPSIEMRNLPSRDMIFEFDLTKGEKGMQASKIAKIYP